MSTRARLAPATLLSCAQMAAADAHTISSGLFTGSQLMARAAAAIVDIVLRDFSAARRIHVLSGPGNNGGDGYVVATLLAARGLDVAIYAYGTPKAGTDAALAAAHCTLTLHALGEFEPDQHDLVIDALFGAGFRGDLPEAVMEALGKAASAGASIVAVDLPSGIHGDTGLFSFAVQCDATVTFYRKKPAHCLWPADERCGKLHVADIGVRAEPLFNPAEINYAENHPALWAFLLPELPTHAHKYSRGHVAVFSGPRHATGAARLSAWAAQRAGAGAVTFLGSASAIDMHAHHVTSIMLKSHKRGEGLAAFDSLNQPRSAVLGPGFGDLDTARELAIGILQRRHEFERPMTLVLDADGITAFKEQPEALFEAAAFEHGLGLVLTPHEGEFARLFPDIAADSSLGKPQKALAAAHRANAVVVYKGPDTVIAAPPGDFALAPRVVINTHSTAKLATAGSGDVLAGIIASLTAQNMPPFEAACAAVWLHAEAAMRAGAMPVAEDLVAALRSVFESVIAPVSVHKT